MPKQKKPFFERVETAVGFIVLVVTICTAFAVYKTKVDANGVKLENHEIRIDDLEEKDLRKEFQLQTIEEMAEKTEDFTEGMETVLTEFIKSYNAMKEYNQEIKKELQEYRNSQMNDTLN